MPRPKGATRGHYVVQPHPHLADIVQVVWIDPTVRGPAKNQGVLLNLGEERVALLRQALDRWLVLHGRQAPADEWAPGPFAVLTLGQSCHDCQVEIPPGSVGWKGADGEVRCFDHHQHPPGVPAPRSQVVDLDSRREDQ